MTSAPNRQKNRIFLKTFSILETHGTDDLELEFPKVDLGSFNLLIGDNAQGKTRLLRILRFIKGLLLVQGNRQRLLTNFIGNFSFNVTLNEEVSDHLTYQIEIKPSNEGNFYTEIVQKNHKVILSTIEGNKTLVDEDTNQIIDNFFVPPNTLALAAITESKFRTIKLIREFFLRMLILDSSKAVEQTIDPAALILNSDASNLPDVLFNWKEKAPDLFKDVIKDFKRCFSFVQDIKFQPLSIPLPGVKPIRLAIQEEGIKREITQENWSGGFGRALSILCLPKTQFDFEGLLYPPSLIGIDEVDTSLDFKTTKFITNYLKDYSDQIQILLSSHSPIMSEFIHPKDWLIVRRKGAKIIINKPESIESNLDEQLDFFRQKYWDFYTKHISGSDLYDPK